MSPSVSSLRRSFVVLALVLVGALMAASVPTGTVAQDDEPLQNIEQFEPISISHEMVSELEAVAEEMDPLTLLMVYMQLQDLGEFETDITEDHIQKVDSIDEVNDHLDGSIVLPGDLPSELDSDDAFYATSDEGYAAYTFDVEIAHRISRLLELPTDWLPDPEEQSHATISVDVPRGGLVGWETSEDRMYAGQIGMPEIELPEDLDLEALREAILDDPRLPDDLADQLGAIDDWETTMPVPVPEGAEYEDVSVQGDPGFLLTMDGESVLVWIGDNTLHFVAGSFDADELMDVAESVDASAASASSAQPFALRLTHYQ